MAKSNQTVITVEPSSHEKDNPYFQLDTFDENGDEIKFEGICNRRGIVSQIACWVITAAIGMSLLGGILIIPCVIVWCFRYVKTWRLYVTSKGIHYTRSYCCCPSHWFIPFSDIEDIYVAYGSKHTVGLKMDPSTIKTYLNWCQRPLLYELKSLGIAHVKNADEFVAAVKKEQESN